MRDIAHTHPRREQTQDLELLDRQLAEPLRQVKTGEELPAIGSYSSTLLMEMIYL